jgi:hypothetical protein
MINSDLVMLYTNPSLPANDIPILVAPSTPKRPEKFASDGITTLLRLPHHSAVCRISAALRRTVPMASKTRTRRH